MATQPTNDLLIWANTDVNLPNLAGPNKTEPSADLVAKGWDFKQKPSADEFNYILNNYSEWIEYLKDYVDEGDAASAGSVIYFARNSAPVGYLKANGAAISRTTYAALFAAIGTTFGAGDGSTTFNLPDLRGEFLRGYDDGRGIDVSRVFGSTQSSQNLLHEHIIFGTGVRSDHRLTFESPGVNICEDPMVKMTATVYPANDAAGRGSDFKATGNGGGESRPRNIALLACIKY